jgi:hypothetical protein
VIIVVMAVQALMIHLLWGKDLRSTPERRARVMAMNASETIRDWTLLKQSLVVLTAVILLFVLARPLHLEPATIALAGAAVLMFLDNWQHHTEKQSENVHKTFSDVSGSRSSSSSACSWWCMASRSAAVARPARQQAGRRDRAAWRRPATPCGPPPSCRRSSTISRSSPP